MPYKYTTITQPVPLYGLNTRDEPTLMNRLYTPDMQNVEIDRSLVKKRLGYSTMGDNLPLSGIGMELIEYIDGQGVKHSIALTTTDAYLYDGGGDTWDKITPNDGAGTPTYTQFTGGDTDRWSYTVATNPANFLLNGGTALLISNGADKLFAYEGQTGDYFKPLAISTELSNFQYSREIFDFWNHLFLMNYSAATPAKDFVRNAAFHDVSSDGAYADLGITEAVLTDSIGTIRRAVKLGYDGIIYSDSSITICRRVGGSALFIFPSVVFESGLFADRAIWNFANQHFFIGTDQKLYLYQGGTQLMPIGLLIEEQFFADIDPSKKDYIVAGVDKSKHKIYWFYPRTPDQYSQSYYAYNYEKNPTSWEKGRLGHEVAAMSVFSNQITWTFDGPQVDGKGFDDDEFAATPFNSGSATGGFPQTTFMDRDGYVYRFTTEAASDSGLDIEAWVTTPDLIPVEGRTDDYARFNGFNFSAMSDISDSTVLVSYSTDEGDNWTDMQTVSLTDEWVQYRLPCDVKTQKARFRIYQNSQKDFKIRHMSYKVQLNTDK